MRLDCENKRGGLKMTLEGKLEGVNIGDIILIQGRDGNAVGYVGDISRIFISLAQRDINNPAKYRTHDDLFPSTYTGYVLKKFESYQVLKKKE